jgi:electron transfer flavoprotein alpha subunit
MTFLVYSELDELAFQLLGGAREIADHLGVEVASLVSGDNEENHFAYGADVVIKPAGLEKFDADNMKAAVMAAVKKLDPRVILIGATKRGKELASRVASMLNVGCMNDCVNIELSDENKIIVERLTYGGSIISRQSCESVPMFITMPQGIFEKKLFKRVGDVTEIMVEPVESKLRILEQRNKPKSNVDLENAQVIVSAGRGFKAKEDLRILEDLAEALGAQMGCTRPISADLGWMDQWVGISGKKVRPNLYIACGVSGTIQHVAGIRDSKIIVSINSDESAGIHGISDYSIVGDVYEVIPALAKAIKEAK